MDDKISDPSGRKRQVETTRKRHGKDFYKKIGDKGATYRIPGKGRLAALKRWHPDWFDAQGNLIKDLEVENVDSSQRS